MDSFVTRTFKKIKIQYAGNSMVIGFISLLSKPWNLIRYLTSKRKREDKRAQSKHRNLYLQGSSATRMDRYPGLFGAAKRIIQISNPRILSFGCSTGEEILSLKKYFPEAEFIGVDVNDWCLEQCRQKSTLSNHKFHHFDSQEFKALKDIDIIFCMAVLQNTQNRSGITEIPVDGFTFQKFENTCTMIAAKLKVGGILIIDETDFNFEDTDLMKYFNPLIGNNTKSTGTRPLFSKHNKMVSKKQVAMNRVFKKMKDSQ